MSLFVPWTQESRGYEFAKNGEYDKAIKAYTEAIQLNPNSAWAYASRGVAYTNVANSTRLSTTSIRPLGSIQRTPVVYCQRGTVYTTKGDYEKAIIDFSRYIELQTNDPCAVPTRNEAMPILQKASMTRRSAIIMKPSGSLQKIHGNTKVVDMPIEPRISTTRRSAISRRPYDLIRKTHGPTKVVDMLTTRQVKE